MPVDTSIYSLLKPVPFSLAPFGQGVEMAAGLTGLREQQRQLAEEEAFRQQFAQQFGEGQPAGLAGLAPQMTPGAVQEKRLGGGPTANFHGAQPLEAPAMGPVNPAEVRSTLEYTPTGQPVNPAEMRQTLEDRSGGMWGDPQQARQTLGLGGLRGQMGGQDRAFVNQLYAVSPKGAMAYEKHLADQQRAAGEAQEAQMRANVARVEFLGRVADGVLESDNPQRAWDAGRAMLIAQGMPESQVPPVYDPSYVQQLSGMARDAKDRYNEGMLRLQQSKEQRERTQLAQAIPDYGLGDKLNAAVYATHGQEIAPGQAPTPAQIQSGRQRLIAEEREAEENKAITQAGAKAPQQQAERENQLRDEYNTLSKDYRTQSDAYGRVQVSAQDPSAAGDLSLIFSYMKLLDPGSVVREGEQATAANARGVDESIRSYYNRVLTGQRLAPEQRKDFVDRAQRLYDQATADNTRIRTQYEDRAKRYGVDPKNVTTDFGSTARQTLSEADIAATIADSQKPGNKPLTRHQVIEWGRKNQYKVPEQ